MDYKTRLEVAEGRTCQDFNFTQLDGEVKRGVTGSHVYFKSMPCSVENTGILYGAKGRCKWTTYLVVQVACHRVAAVHMERDEWLQDACWRQSVKDLLLT